jgi:5'-nucleotidase
MSRPVAGTIRTQEDPMLTRTVSTRALLAAATCFTLAAGSAHGQYSLTILHNNDGESDLLGGTGNAGSVAEFKTLLDTTRNFYTGLDHGVVTLSSGDNFLPGIEFEASLRSGDGQTFGTRTYYDALAIDAFDYDAVVIGNHDFDAGPDVLADFIAQTGNTQYLSANLDVSGEANLAALGSKIAGSTVVTKQVDNGGTLETKSIGIIGATTENLPFISSPGNVVVNDVVAAINNEITSLQGQNVDHIIIASHLQGLDEDIDLSSQLVAPVDLFIAGGGDEFLASTSAPSPQTVYGAGAPQSIVDTGLPLDRDGNPVVPDGLYPALGSGNVPIVTTPGEYDWLGRITLDFDSNGDLLAIDSSSNLQENVGFVADGTLQTNVVDPVQQFKNGLSQIVLAQSSELLLGNGDRDVIRAKEAGLGNLVADGFFDAATDFAAANNVDAPDLAFVNGGGIRDDIEVGDISVATTFDISPFGSAVAVVEDVTAEDLKLIFENAYSRTTDGDPTPNGPDGQGVDPVRANVDGTGRFLHVSEGVEIVYDLTADALELDNDGNLVAAGSRIVDLVVNGETVVEDGQVVSSSTFDIATVDFLANGGDQTFAAYLAQDYAFTRLSDPNGGLITDQSALESYLTQLAGAQGAGFDLVSDARYDNVADGRIVAIPEPTTAGLLALGGLGLLARRRRG